MLEVWSYLLRGESRAKDVEGTILVSPGQLRAIGGQVHAKPRKFKRISPKLLSAPKARDQESWGYDAAQDKDVARKFERVPFPKVNPYTAECEYFAQCILDGRLPEINDGTNAVTILRIVERALKSGKTKAILPV